jgi:hypothetical protein
MRLVKKKITIKLNHDQELLLSIIENTYLPMRYSNLQPFTHKPNALATALTRVKRYGVDMFRAEMYGADMMALK